MRRREAQALGRRRRGAWAASLLGVLLVVIALGFLRLQVLDWDRYALESSENRLRTVTVPAPRGRSTTAMGAPWPRTSQATI